MNYPDNFDAAAFRRRYGSDAVCLPASLDQLACDNRDHVDLADAARAFIGAVVRLRSCASDMHDQLVHMGYRHTAAMLTHESLSEFIADADLLIWQQRHKGYLVPRDQIVTKLVNDAMARDAKGAE